jgi:hypothetical protein
MSAAPPPAAPEPPAPAATRAWLLILALGAALFGLRLAAPADLTDNDQERPASYVLDAVQNGHWLIQRDAYDDIASKPPLLTWLAGLATWIAGRPSRFTLYLPCAVAIVGTAWLIQAGARARFGTLAGLLGALSLLFSQYGFKHVVLARNDALFAFTVSLAALAAFRAWTAGRGWTWYWLAAAAATLTKGPLGVLLAAGGLLAVAWERREAEPLALRGRIWPGALLWLAVVGGWFVLAWLSAGDDLIRKQLGRELAGHLTGAEAGGRHPFSDPLHSLLYFLSRYAPWSLAACVGFWRVWRQPAAGAAERRFERFLLCWFALGLLVFTLAPHKRPDLLLPIIPAAAMLAGRELAGWLGRFHPQRVWLGATLGSVALLGVLAVARPQGRDTAGEVGTTRAMRELAEGWEQSGPRDTPLTFVGHTLTVQFYLNRHQLVVTPAQAARLLEGDAACALVTRDLAAVRQHLPADFAPQVFHAAPAGGEPRGWLVTNQREPVGTHSATAVGIGPLHVRLDGAAFVQARRFDLVLRRTRPDAQVEVVNESDRPVTVGVFWTDEPGQQAGRSLAAGERWVVGSR